MAMAASLQQDPHLRRVPFSKSIDSVLFLPSVSALDRHVVAAVHSPSLSSLEVHSLPSDDPSAASLRASWPSPSRITSLSLDPSHPLLALATSSGSLHLLHPDPLHLGLLAALPPDPHDFHRGSVSALDLRGSDCVTAAEEGRIHLIPLAETGLAPPRRMHDVRGLTSYTAVRWASPREFATGSYGLGVQLWDPRRPEGLAAQLKGNQVQGIKSGVVHSIDVHPSRQHICIVGCSSGVIFAWDLRWQQQPILLCGPGIHGNTQSLCESEVWKVQCDSHTHSSFSSASSKVRPVMMCFEDGILAVVRQDEDPIELLAENCAINSFDIDPENPSDVVCALDWESILILARPRESIVAY